MVALLYHLCYFPSSMKTLTLEEQRKRWGQAIREARQRKGISQEELAALWENSFSYLTKIETGAKGNEATFQDLMQLIARHGESKKRKAS